MAWVLRPREEHRLALGLSRGRQSPRNCSGTQASHVFLITLLFVKAAGEPRNCGSFFPLSFTF